MSGISSAIEFGENASRLYDLMLGRQTGGRIFGRGDYTVNKNTIMGDSAIPTFSGGKNYIDIVHRECIVGNVQSSTAFTIQETVNLNPGLLAPWLSRMATLFEEYEAMGVVFQFRSTSADALNSTNTALGTVVMMTDYDAYDAPPTSKIRMEASEFATSTKPSLDVLHPVECKPKLNPLARQYIRNGPVSTGDLRLYDQGTFYLATEGMQAVSTIGELWVTYHYRFFKPTLPDSEYVLASDYYYLFGTLSANEENPFGNGAVLEPGSSDITTLTGVQTLVFNEVGDYNVTVNSFFDHTSSITNWTTPVVTNLLGCTLLDTHRGIDTSYTITDVAASIGQASGATNVVSVITFGVSVTTAGASMDIDVGTVDKGCTYTGDLHVVRMQPNPTFNEDPRERRLKSLEDRLSKLQLAEDAKDLQYETDFDTRSVRSTSSRR
jgi:hypothetical protein